jgi:hypothetical protein
VWDSAFRGRLWIHAASKPVTPDEIQQTEDFYRNVFSTDGVGVPSFPQHYPTSVLVGMVEVVEVVAATEFARWESLPEGARWVPNLPGLSSTNPFIDVVLWQA